MKNKMCEIPKLFKQRKESLPYLYNSTFHHFSAKTTFN